jgi:hypothetical protein
MGAKRERIRRSIPTGPGPSATAGVNHLAVFAKDLEATAKFYADVLGLPVVNISANLDVADSSHMNIRIGNGTNLSFFDFPPFPGSAAAPLRVWAGSCTPPCRWMKAGCWVWPKNWRPGGSNIRRLAVPFSSKIPTAWGLS